VDGRRLQSIKGDRVTQWYLACEAWGFDTYPRFASDTLAAMPPGTLSFSATRAALIEGAEATVKVDVDEVWREGPGPQGDRRLEMNGCQS